jgi:hypothetical protein
MQNVNEKTGLFLALFFLCVMQVKNVVDISMLTTRAICGYINITVVELIKSCHFFME